MWAQIYTGCKCGETWRTTVVEDVDIVNDEVYGTRLCTTCNTEVREQKFVNGIPEVHVLTEEEVDSELYWGETDDDYEY